jgi:hypothetical protein
VTLETIGSVLGAGLASAGIVVVSARRWLSQRAENKIDAVAKELGVGIGPTIASLVMSTAGAVQRLEGHMGGSSERIENLIRIQGEHAARLLDHESRFVDHEGRIVVIEERHETCAFNSGQVASLLAQKTENVARVLAEHTEHVAEALAIKTAQTAKKLRGGKRAA